MLIPPSSPWLAWKNLDGTWSPLHFVDFGRVGRCGDAMPLDAQGMQSSVMPGDRTHCCSACLVSLEIVHVEVAP